MIPTLLVYLLTVFFNTAIGQEPAINEEPAVELVVLGIAQDAGYPQAGCLKPCCQSAWKDPSIQRWVSCVAVVDHKTQQRFLFDCTPDFPAQWQWLETNLPPDPKTRSKIDGIFLTHAHIGHYTGLMHLGREAMGTKEVPAYAMPRMAEFLTKNGPWNLLVELGNIKIQPLVADQPVRLSERLSVTPILVPIGTNFPRLSHSSFGGLTRLHCSFPISTNGRVGTGPSKNNRSSRRGLPRRDVSRQWGIAGRDMSTIPHPFIQESINQFAP